MFRLTFWQVDFLEVDHFTDLPDSAKGFITLILEGAGG
jgi:hypothetical protein